MDLDEVNAAVARISAEAHDPEMAHSDEDELHQAVLRHIADLETAPGEPRVLCAAALGTREIRFAHWCA